MRMRQRQRRERGRSQYNTETHHKKGEVLCTRTIIVVGKMEAGLLGDFHLLAQVEQDVGELLLRATDEIFMDGVGLTTGGVLGDDGTGAGARATMPLINEGRTEMESRMTPFLSASYRADEAVIYSAHVPIRALPAVLAHRSRLWPTTTKKVFEISVDKDGLVVSIVPNALVRDGEEWSL